MPTKDIIGVNECSSIGGTYKSAGSSNSNISENYANPVFSWIFFHRRDIAHPTNIFDLDLDEQHKKLNFEIFDKDNLLLLTGLSMEYSACEDDGWVVVKSNVKGGSGDSPVKSVKKTIQFSIAADRSLIIHSRQEAVWRRFFFGSETRVSEIWYRFERAKE